MDRKQQLVRRIMDRWRNDMPVIRVAWDSPHTDTFAGGYRFVYDLSRSALLYNSRMGLAAREKRK